MTNTDAFELSLTNFSIHLFFFCSILTQINFNWHALSELKRKMNLSL